MLREIVLPDLGTAGPVRLSAWFVRPGESVFEGDRVAEVSAGGATFDVAAPAGGRLAAVWAVANDALHAGQALGAIEAGGV